jgi:dinuclear metal center YbgI/SA1388 family protein
MKVKEITSAIEAYAPLAYQESYDNSGMQVGNPDQEISGALITLDVTEEVIDEAIQKGCNLIIAHHPLIFRGQKKICGYNYIERCIIKAIKHDIAIYASHTCMDKTIGGVSAKMAEKLGMTEIRPLEEEKYGEQIVGLGVIGMLPQADDAMDFLRRVKKTFQADSIRHTSIGKGKKVRRVALCGGSASEFLGKAIAEQADIYITADVKYHQFFEVEDHIILADIGHFESEQFTKEIFYEIISKINPKFAVHISESKTNPINYL